VINKIKLYFVESKNHSNTGYTCAAHIKTGGIEYTGTHYETTEDVWTLRYHEWTKNPNTNLAWTWADIDSLQIGVQFYLPGGSRIEVTQIYLMVFYDQPTAPPGILIDTCSTQLYAIVNYNPSVSTVTLPLPDSIGMSHSRKINRFTFPDGGYEVEDMARSGKTLSLTGWSSTNMTTKMQDIADMSHYGSSVSVSGLPDSNLNTDYYIRSFDFNQKGGETELYTWRIDLECA